MCKTKPTMRRFITSSSSSISCCAQCRAIRVAKLRDIGVRSRARSAVAAQAHSPVPGQRGKRTHRGYLVAEIHMKTMKTHTALFAALLVLWLLPAFALADAAQARKYIADAKEAGEHHSWDDAENRLKLAEGEIDDAPAADKAAVSKEIEATRKSLLTARREWDRPGFIQSVQRYIDSARGNVTVSGRVEQDEEQLEYKLK